jgi:multidrug efflux pump subunit AcrA (membrane-fusion protein)
VFSQSRKGNTIFIVAKDARNGSSRIGDHPEAVNDAITIPESSLEFSVDSVYVYILADSVKHTFIRKQVVTGISDGVNIEIKEGLNINDKVRGIEIKGI